VRAWHDELERAIRRFQDVGADLIWLLVIIVLAFGIQIPPQLILNHRPGQRPESGPIPQPKRKTQ
jgi:hypothetical protein